MKTIRTAVGATFECESYFVGPSQSGAVVAPVQVESKGQCSYGYDDIVNSSNG